MMASLVSSSLKTGRVIFIWPLGSLWGYQPWHGCLEPLDPLDHEDTDEAVDIELQPLSNLGSGEGEGSWVGAAHCCCHLWPWSWALCGTQPCSWCAGQGPGLGTSYCSAIVGMFAGHGDQSWLWKLNSVDAGEIEWGWPAPLGLMCPSVMAWEVSCWPSLRLAGLALSWTCLPTQLMAPDSVNTASHALPKLRPFPNTCHP